MGHITAGASDLMQQASMTACTYMNEAISAIDRQFGTGYAKEHPELIAAFMKVSASDMNYATLAKAQSEAIETLSDSINNLSAKINS